MPFWTPIDVARHSNHQRLVRRWQFLHHRNFSTHTGIPNPVFVVAACPLRSDRIRSAAPQRIDAGCQYDMLDILEDTHDFAPPTPQSEPDRPSVVVPRVTRSG